MKIMRRNLLNSCATYQHNILTNHIQLNRCDTFLIPYHTYYHIIPLYTSILSSSLKNVYLSLHLSCLNCRLIALFRIWFPNCRALFHQLKHFSVFFMLKLPKLYSFSITARVHSNKTSKFNFIDAVERPSSIRM